MNVERPTIANWQGRTKELRGKRAENSLLLRILRDLNWGIIWVPCSKASY